MRKHNEESAAFYHSKQWNLLAKAAASRANYVDEYLLRYEGKVKPGRIVHHIIPVKEDKAHALSPKNLVYLSDKTHALVHKAYDKSREDKMAMQAKLAMIRMDY